MRTIAEIIGGKKAAGADPIPVGLFGTRSETLYRVQVGLSGIVAILLILALASVIIERADRAEANSVPDAAATVAPSPVHSQQNDPLADTGVVPDLRASPTPTSTGVPVIELGPENDFDEQ